MTPILKGAAGDDGTIVLKVIPPEPPIHWIWVALHRAVFIGGWLVMVIGVWWSG